MRKDRSGARAKRDRGGEARPSGGAQQRAQDLLLRLETDGDHLQTAAEELDRLQARLEEAGLLPQFRERVAALATAWASLPLRGDRGHAWLSLVGAFDLKEQDERTAELLTSAGLPPALRAQAARALSRLGGETAVAALQETVLSPTDPQVRAAAAEAIGTMRERSLRPVLEALLEEDLPRRVWDAVSAAADRLR